MRIFPQELLIMRLKGTLPSGSRFAWMRAKTVEDCLRELKEFSGIDLGPDPKAWADWWKAERVRLDIDPDF